MRHFYSLFRQQTFKRGWDDAWAMVGVEKEGTLMFLFLVFLLTVLVRRPISGCLQHEWFMEPNVADDLATVFPSIALFVLGFLYNWLRAPRRIWWAGAQRQGLEERDKRQLAEFLTPHGKRSIDVVLSDPSRQVLCSDILDVFQDMSWIGPVWHEFHTDPYQTRGIWICGRDAQQTEKLIAEAFNSIALSYELQPKWRKGYCVTIFVGRIP